MSETKRVLSKFYRILRDEGYSPAEAEAILHAEVTKAIPIAAAAIMEDPRVQAIIKGKQ